jgi:hypothetical protein
MEKQFYEQSDCRIRTGSYYSISDMGIGGHLELDLLYHGALLMGVWPSVNGSTPREYVALALATGVATMTSQQLSQIRDCGLIDITPNLADSRCGDRRWLLSVRR